LLAFNVGVFGVWGILVWFIQISWATFWLTIVVAIGAHHFGYHKTNSNDNSRNLWPIAIVAAGEELHHNHHLDPSNPNLRTRWFEFDLGYIYMKMFEFFGLLRFNK
jgi:stearoyl-CoA desaturase (delta-9 desaturase)